MPQTLVVRQAVDTISIWFSVYTTLPVGWSLKCAPGGHEGILSAVILHTPPIYTLSIWTGELPPCPPNQRST